MIAVARPIRRRVLATVAGITVGVIVAAIPSGRLVTSRAFAADDVLTIRQQVFNLAIGGSFDVTVGLPDGVDATTLGAGAVVTVVSHPLVATRAQFLAALDGELSDIDDSFAISLDPAQADQSVTRPSADSLSLTVPTSTSPLDVPDDPDETPATEATPVDTAAPTGTGPEDSIQPDIKVVGPGTLQFYETGVHPVEIQLRVNGRLVAQAATFVNIVDPTPPPDDMSIGLIVGQTVQPTIDDEGTVSLTEADTDELSRMADTLTGIDSAAAALGLTEADVPRVVFVEPATLQAITASDPALATRLTPGLVSSEVVAAPRLPFDASAAAAAGQDDRYASLLSNGEDELTELLPRTVIERTLYIVHEPFTTEAAALQRKMGARLMVMSFDLYNRGEGGNGMLTDTSQLVTIALPGTDPVPAVIVDPHLATRIDRGATDPMLTSIQIVADLLVVAQSIADDGGDASRHGMVLARTDLGVPDAQLMTDVVTLLSSTDGLRLVDPIELGSTVDVLRQPRSRQEVTVTLPQQAAADLDDRLQLITDVSREIYAFASTLPDGAPQIDSWLRVLDALPSTAVDDTIAAAMVAGLRDQFNVYRSGVVGPDPFTFTLTGRHNTVTFTLRNTTDAELKVRVRLSSPKLTFPDGDQVVALPAQGEQEIKVRAEALSNGKSSVFLRVYTLDGNSDIQLMPEVVLTARVSSLAGLGQLLTGAGLLLLLTWWGRHWQQTRRKRDRHRQRQQAPVLQRH